MSAINRVVLVGNLTRDPETRQAGATTVCSLRLAVNDRTKDAKSGEWRDNPNFFDVAVFGSLAERCAQYLGKGRQVAIDGHLRYREWESDGGRRSAVSVVAESVQFIGAREGAAAPANVSDCAASDPDDDIPF